MTVSTSLRVLLVASALGCLDPRSILPGSEAGAAAPDDAVPAGPEGTTPPAGAEGNLPSAGAPAAATHTRLGIRDPERGNMVAHAVQVPVGWKTSQRMTRTWEGAVAVSQVGLVVESPDGAHRIEWFPGVTHTWADGPMTAGLRAQKRSFGLDPRMSPDELAPMAAAAYTRQVAIPRLAQAGWSISGLGNDQDAPETQTSAQDVLRRGSVDGTLPDGSRVRVESRLYVGSRTIQSDTYTRWTVLTSVTRSSTDLEAAYAHTRAVQDSFVTNPEWQAMERQDQERGYAANADASRRQHEATMAGIQQNTASMTAAHNARMDAIQQFGAQNTANYQDRMATMDTEQAQRVAVIRGESLYADPTTGQRVMVEDGSNQVYRANNGLDLGNAPIIGTNTPLDPQQVDWVALQQVPLQEY